ncbi:ABC transporter substrate-binding protein [Nocardia miyunensis]|uniref:ABC transporter substrate-binding protein n=1 Tax=Nocardia miyunensis TaxID=282684 RepID=UPI00083194A6|nr:ABC transporter substrate-binding protein [Nocardia miyunensis]
MIARRAILQGGLVLPLAAACAPEVLGGDSGAVRIAVSWSGNELSAFRAVLAGLASAGTFIGRVEVVPLGDDINTALSAGGRDAPDIVMLPDPGSIQTAARTGLRPLSELRAEAIWKPDGQQAYSQSWYELLWHADCGRAPRLYGVPFKAANMSLVWFDRSAFPGYDPRTCSWNGIDGPERWSLTDWAAYIEQFARSGRHLFALGAADGWVLAYHFANVLRAVAPRSYVALSEPDAEAGNCWPPKKPGLPSANWDHHHVRAALTMLGKIWCVPGAFAGGVAEPLRRQFPDAIRDVFQHRHAAMVVAPDYAEPIVRDSLRRTGRPECSVGVIGFPGYQGWADGPPNIGGGDVMVITADASPRAEDLVAALAAAKASQPWIDRYGGFVPPNVRTADPASYTGLFDGVADRMGRWDVFDFADLVGPRGRRDGLWRILTRFLIDVGDRGERAVGPATERAIADLERTWE